MNSIFYFENTEYGGKITKLKVDTGNNKLYYGGRTFYGMLCDKVIAPNAGQNYYIVSGDANSIISTLMNRFGLSDLFSASTGTSGFTFTNYKFDRYINCYKGLCKMLKTKNAKLRARFEDRKVVLSAVSIEDYSDKEFSSDILKFTIEQNKRPVNHLVCLGQGELAQRTVINLYADANGNVSQTQYFTDLDEVAETYDYSNVESPEELLKAGTEKLLEYQKADEINITIENAEKDVGDIVGGYEVVTGMKITGEISKKIVKVENNNDPQFSYEVGK